MTDLLCCVIAQSKKGYCKTIQQALSLRHTAAFKTSVCPIHCLLDSLHFPHVVLPFCKSSCSYYGLSPVFFLLTLSPFSHILLTTHCDPAETKQILSAGAGEVSQTEKLKMMKEKLKCICWAFATWCWNDKFNDWKNGLEFTMGYFVCLACSEKRLDRRVNTDKTGHFSVNPTKIKRGVFFKLHYLIGFFRAL